MRGALKTTSGRIAIRYASRKAICDTCQLRARCLSRKATTRIISRWEHEDVLERHRARMHGADELMRRRSAIVEHPFGTLKCRAGYRHFLVRGVEKVRGEWSLMALCYNFTRVLNILGLDRFIACLRKRRADFLRLPLLASTMGPASRFMVRIGVRFTKKSSQIRFRLSPAT